MTISVPIVSVQIKWEITRLSRKYQAVDVYTENLCVVAIMKTAVTKICDVLSYKGDSVGCSRVC